MPLHAAFETCLAQTEELEPLMVELRPQLPSSPQYQDLAHGLRVMARYITRSTPEIMMGGLHVLDVGPGVGCFLMLARALENHVMGEELDPTVGGSRSRAYKEILDACGIDISYGGLHRYLTPHFTKGAVSFVPYPHGPFDFVHFRGSLDAVLNPLRSVLDVTVKRLVDVLCEILNPGGIAHVAHNDDAMREQIMSLLRKHSESKLELGEPAPFVTRLRKA